MRYTLRVAVGSNHEVEAVKFDPLGLHKMNLPAGVEGVPSPGADNWAYSECRFWVPNGGELPTPIEAGDYVVTDVFGYVYAQKGDTFETLYEPVTVVA